MGCSGYVSSGGGLRYYVWAKEFQISKKYFRIFQKSLDISEIEISFLYRWSRVALKRRADLCVAICRLAPMWRLSEMELRHSCWPHSFRVWPKWVHIVQGRTFFILIKIEGSLLLLSEIAYCKKHGKVGVCSGSWPSSFDGVVVISTRFAIPWHLAQIRYVRFVQNELIWVTTQSSNHRSGPG